MVEERITRVEGDGAPTTHTTVIHETPRSSGATGIVIAVVLLVAVIAGIYLFNRSAASDSAKDNAIASAANDVGDAAKKVGSAAEDAADSATNK